MAMGCFFLNVKTSFFNRQLGNSLNVGLRVGVHVCMRLSVRTSGDASDRH